MNKLPTKYILSIKPQEYLEQGPSHCGVYSIKGILSAYGLDTKTHPKYYHPYWVGRITGSGFGKNYYVDILSQNGLKAQILSSEDRSDQERIYLLNEMLAKNTPVMIRIGNGYISDKYNPVIGRVVSHWITLWGYDNDKKVFYIYDSGLPNKFWSKTQQVGNTTRTYNELLRDWNFGKWQPWAWTVTGPHNFAYIEIKTVLERT